MKKILVFGGNGMAGHMIVMHLKSLNKYQVYNTVRKSILDENSIVCDILDMKKVIDIIMDLKPDIIINCIGILNDKSNIDISKTIYSNSFFPQYLKVIGENYNIKVIHLSTDCVFTGFDGNYNESDIKDEMNIYGLSKNIGEIINNKDLTIRTSIIGPELKANGKGLFHWFMNQENYVYGYKNVYWSGVTTLELAKAIDRAIDVDLCNLYHLVPNYKISKLNLLNIIKEVFNKENTSVLVDDKIILDKSMINNRVDFDFNVKDYKTMILEMKIFMDMNKEMYRQYKL